MTSLGAVKPPSLPVRWTPTSLGSRTSQASPAIASPQTAPAAVRRVRVGTDHESTREGVVLEDDLVDDAGARPPEVDAVLPRGGAEEVVDLLVFPDGALEVLRRARL